MGKHISADQSELTVEAAAQKFLIYQRQVSQKPVMQILKPLCPENPVQSIYCRHISYNVHMSILNIQIVVLILNRVSKAANESTY